MAPLKKTTVVEQPCTNKKVVKRTKTTKKKEVVVKKPNPRQPSIVKLKIKKSKTNASPETVLRDDENSKPISYTMKNISSEFKIQIANEVANLQLAKKPFLAGNAMVDISEELLNKVLKKRKNTDESAKVNRKKTIVKPNPPKKRKLATGKQQTAESNSLEQPVPQKKRRGRPKRVLGEGKNGLKAASLAKSLITQNACNSSPAASDASDVTRLETKQDANLDNFSWISDISASSRSTASLQTVAIDGKVPIVRLVDCRYILNGDVSSASEATCLSLQNSPSKTLNGELHDDSLSVTSKSLSLSSSSSSSTSSSSGDSVHSAVRAKLEKVNQILNKLDLEFIKWLGNEQCVYSNNGPHFNILQQEAEYLNKVPNYRRRFAEMTSPSESEKCNSKKFEEKKETENVENSSDIVTPVMPVRPYDYTCATDDDDAISLYAESFSSLDSSRVLQSAPCSPKRNDIKDITETEEIEQIKGIECQPAVIEYVPAQTTPNTVCEKQNADSTVNKEVENVVVMKKGLMGSYYTAVPAVKSMVFRGVCFFNMVSQCKKHGCVFRHVEMQVGEVLSRVARLSEPAFVQEYLLLRKFPQLRNKYMPAFAQEFAKRNLTDFLVEMAIDCCRVDAAPRTSVLETILEHLDDKELSAFQDILSMNWSPCGTLVCEEFMRAIADTQNFGRFKRVFVSMVDFVLKLGKVFDLDVTEKLLERVCILPYEEPLTKSLILMIKNTDSKIFENVLMGRFENKLASCNKEIYEELLQLKAPATGQPAAEDTRYTSPDTTHPESRLKMDGPIITRVIDSSNITRTFVQNASPASEPSPPDRTLAFGATMVAPMPVATHRPRPLNPRPSFRPRMHYQYRPVSAMPRPLMGQSLVRYPRHRLPHSAWNAPPHFPGLPRRFVKKSPLK